MIHIKQDISLKAWVRSPGVDSGWGRGQNETFSEYGHISYQIKTYVVCSNVVANILPTDTPSTLGRGQKVKSYFSESSHVAI